MIECITTDNFTFILSYPYNKFSEQDVLNVVDELFKFFDSSVFDVRYNISHLSFTQCYIVYVIVDKK